jgi:diguanylate cyclase (GGDEF)-like protein
VEADHILSLLRPLVLVVDATGTVLEHHGARGGFHGYGPEDFVGASVFDFVAPEQVDELATYFLEAAGRSASALELPMPFRLVMLDRSGGRCSVDVIPTGDTSEGEVRWIVAVVPDELQTAVARSLEAEMAGAPREQVKRLLTEELLVENSPYRARWFLVDLSVPSGPTVTTSRDEDQALAEALSAEVATGWRPWGGVEAGTIAALSRDDLAPPLADLARARGWRRVTVTPVHVDGALVAAYLMFGRVPDDDEVIRIDPNVAGRIRRLVDATALLVARWQDRDRLVAAATRDPLTGLANRDAFADALASADPASTVLYVDVDRFKGVNDLHGHDVGDRVLVEISRRVASACRPSDVVARFGGDEFVVLLNGVDAQRARAVAERISALVAEPIPELAEQERITVSIGVAPVAAGDAVDVADQAMLKAKRDGRARVIGAEELAC